MVNARMVNGRAACSPHAAFCEFFLVSGRFPRFKNPVKYTRNLRVNPKSGEDRQPPLIFPRKSKALRHALRVNTLEKHLC
jgi:hypothetical protein